MKFYNSWATPEGNRRGAEAADVGMEIFTTSTHANSWLDPKDTFFEELITASPTSPLRPLRPLRLCGCLESRQVC